MGKADQWLCILGKTSELTAEIWGNGNIADLDWDDDTWVQALVKTHLIVYLKWVHFIVDWRNQILGKFK